MSIRETKAIGSDSNYNTSLLVEGLVKAMRFLLDTDLDAAEASLVTIGSEAIEPLLSALRDESRKVRFSASRVLEQLGWQPDQAENEAWYWIAKGEAGKALALGGVAVEPLVHALRYEDANAAMAIYALRSLNPGSDTMTVGEALAALGALAVEPLIAAPLRGNFDLDYATKIAKVLGVIGNPALPSLLSALQDKAVLVRIAAVLGLGEMDTIEATNALFEALRDPHHAVRVLATMQVAQISDNRVIDALVTCAKDDDPDVRRVAIEALSRLGSKRALKPLVAALGEKDKDVRSDALYGLAQIGAPAIKSLKRALDHHDPEVRKNSIIALGSIGTRRGIDSIFAALFDSDPQVRETAATVLGEQGDEQAIEPLARALETAADTSHAIPIALALGKLGDTRAMDVLQNALMAPYQQVRCEAADVLESLGWEPPTQQIGAWYWISKMQWERVRDFGAVAVDPLIAMIQEGPSGYNLKYPDLFNAVCQLGEIGDPRAVKPLVTALSRQWEDPIYLRQAIFDALIKIGPSAVEPLATLLDAEAVEMRRDVAKSLAWIGGAQAVEALVSALVDQDESVREASFEGLIRIGPAAIGPLMQAFEDTDTEVSKVAAHALASICAQAIEDRVESAAKSEATLQVREAILQAVIGDGENWGSHIRNWAVSPAGDRIAVSLSDGLGHREDNVFVYDLKGRLLRSFRNDNGGEQGLAFWSDGEHLVIPGCDLRDDNKDGLKLWDLTHKPVARHFLADTPLTDINVTLTAISPRGRYVIGAAAAGNQICVDTYANKWWRLDRLGGSQSVFSVTERYLATWSFLGLPKVRILDLEENAPVFPMTASGANFLCFAGKGDQFLTWEQDYVSPKSERAMPVKTWDLGTMQVIGTETLGEQTLGDAWIRLGTSTADGRTLAVFDSEKNIRLWNTADLTEVLRFPSKLEDASCILFSQSGQELIAFEHSYEHPNRVFVWRLR